MSLSDAHRKTTAEMPNRCENASQEECMGVVCLSSPLSPFCLLSFHLVPTSAKPQTGELREMWDRALFNLTSVSALWALHWSLPGCVKFSFTSLNIYFKAGESCSDILGRCLWKSWSTLTRITKIGNLRSNLYLHWKSTTITSPYVCSQSKRLLPLFSFGHIV